MKRIGGFFAMLLALSALLALSVLAADSGTLVGPDCNNSWKYIEETKTLYLASNVSGYNETGRASYAEDGAWSEWTDEIEHIVLLGNFSKVSERAFEKHSVLRDVCLAENTTALGAYSFYACEKLESVFVLGGERENGFADLQTLRSIENGAFFQTSIEKIALTPECDIGSDYIFPSDALVFAKEDSSAYRILTSGGYKTEKLEEFTLEIIIGDKKIEKSFYSYENIAFPAIDGRCVALYRDAEMTVPYDAEYPSENITLYAAPILSFDGFELRSTGYQGLRAVYSANVGANAGYENYRIKEIGAISASTDGLLRELYIGMAGAFTSSIYLDGVPCGAHLSFPAGDDLRFAHTAVGYGKGEDLGPMSEVKLLFRGYVVLENTETGELFTRYTAIERETLADAAAKVLESEMADALTKTQKAFISAPLDAGGVPEFIYTKKELISMLTMVGSDDTRYILGERLSEEREGLLGALEKYKLASGRYPAILSLELSFAEDNFDLCLEYVKQGGVLSLYSRLPNPGGGRISSPLGSGSESDFSELLMNGTVYNREFNSILDDAAKALERFDAENCPVIWTPFQDMGSGEYWYSPRKGSQFASVLARLGVYVYNYMSETRGLDSIVWAYSSPASAVAFYPGDRYCDIAGLEFLGEDSVSKASNEKIFAFSSFDLSADRPDASIAEGKKKGLAYAVNGGNASLSDIENIMKESSLLGLYEVGELFEMHYLGR